ncbi:MULTISPECIES: hypothetical protein [unclassified Carboxylicivirga]|uniref:hypothetical protein n=1 Tax=Carboxylicivirga TaxID=1628153 RepID=UPI003D34A620
MSKIHWITEAFNMQPVTYSIGQSLVTRTSNGDMSKIEVAEIKLETTRIEGDPFEFYKGYRRRIL